MLWFPVMVNSSWVGQVELVRIDPVDRTIQQDEICTYKLKYFDEQHSVEPAYRSEIKHPYLGKNPIPLLTAALEQIKENYG
jgi:hypothetical protein